MYSVVCIAIASTQLKLLLVDAQKASAAAAINPLQLSNSIEANSFQRGAMPWHMG